MPHIVDDPQASTSDDMNTSYTAEQSIITLLQKINEKQDSIIESNVQIQNSVNALKTDENSKSNTKSDKRDLIENTDENFEQCLRRLRYSTSMDDVLNNFLIKDVFRITNQNRLVCEACEPHITQVGRNKGKLNGIQFEDSSYKQDGDTLPSWFSNLKKALVKHCNNEIHLEYNAFYQDRKEQNEHQRVLMRKSMRYLAYYLIHTNTAFSLWPTLLGVADRCGIVIGNINHSFNFVTKLTSLINTILKQNTVTWFRAQQNITVTLDIGTFHGLALLVTIYIGDNGVTKLGGVRLLLLVKVVAF